MYVYNAHKEILWVMHPSLYACISDIFVIAELYSRNVGTRNRIYKHLWRVRRQTKFFLLYHLLKRIYSHVYGHLRCCLCVIMFLVTYRRYTLQSTYGYNIIIENFWFPRVLRDTRYKLYTRSSYLLRARALLYSNVCTYVAHVSVKSRFDIRPNKSRSYNLTRDQTNVCAVGSDEFEWSMRLLSGRLITNVIYSERRYMCKVLEHRLLILIKRSWLLI